MEPGNGDVADANVKLHGELFSPEKGGSLGGRADARRKVNNEFVAFVMI